MTPLEANRHTPSDRMLIGIGIAAIAVRLLLFLTANYLQHVPLFDCTQSGDPASYLNYARAITGDRSTVTEYDLRVFPGLPAMIALLHTLTGLPFTLAGLAICALGTGVAAALSAYLTDDRRVGWGMVILTPTYLVCGIFVMTEPVLLALVLTGLVAAVRFKKPWIGGILLGIAGVVRPVACFAVAGYLLYALVSRRRAAAGAVAIASLMMVGIGMLLMRRWTGSATTSIDVYKNHPLAYNGELLTWPMKSLIWTPRITHQSALKIAFVWTHFIVDLIACVVIVRHCILSRFKVTIDLLFAPWIVGNLIFVVCVGHTWGFHELPRFITWALPPLLWVFRPILPDRLWAVALLGTVSFTIAALRFALGSI